jgi:hypothetical protein
MHTERAGEFIQCNDGRISASALQAAQILLAETGASLDFFLGKPFLPSDARKISADQRSHVHARKIARLHTKSLSTIVCNAGPRRSSAWLNMPAGHASRSLTRVELK